MSHPIIKTACVAAGLAVAALAVSSAHAGKLNIQQKNDLAAAKALTYKQQAVVSPSQIADGGVVAQVPVELDHYLTASPDAKGKMHVRDTDASGSAPASTVEVSDEI